MSASGKIVGSARSTPAKQRGALERWFGSSRSVQTNLALTTMALPGVILLLIFAYLPMVGLVIAFKDYRFAEGIWGSAWVGFENFRFLFGTDQAWRITRNTLLMNSIFITTGTVASLTIAILMNEVYTSRMSKFYQTMLFFPYFISWIIVSYFVYGFLNGDTGLANQALTAVGAEPIPWYRAPEYWPAILTVANLWNGVGFGSIVYLAG
ncbi:MAG: sugar ABC transporter permease, partial [Caldilineaceae bacterium]|nr:sugar ABC transporter permease [Caldilineaceae bacterium]